MTKTFLYIAGTKVPVLNDAPIPINYQIEDIRNPESTAVTHATTIELPSTKLLDEIFEFSYQPNIKFQTFNPNFRTTCEYWVNNQKIFEGSVKLNKCIWDKDKKVTKYICDFFGIKANLFYEIGQQLLVGNDNPTQDLDFSIYDHTLNLTNVTDSWNNYNVYSGTPTTPMSAGDGYRYGLIDYGYENDGRNKGDDYWFTLKNLRPMLFKQEILYKIFSGAGKTITSSFLSTNFFRNQLISCNDEINISTTIYNQRICKASDTVPQTITNALSWNSVTSTWETPTNTSNIKSFNNDSTLGNYDPNNIFSTSNYRITIPANGNYTITFSALGVMFSPQPTAGSLTPGIFDYYIAVKIEAFLSGSWVGIATQNESAVGNTGAVVKDYNLKYTGFLASGTLVRVDFQSAVTNCSLFDNFGAPYINTSGTANCFFAFNSTINNRPVLICNPDGKKVQEGDLVEVTQCLPKKTKKKDFISSIFQEFNLYCMENPAISGDYIIEPYNDFYSGTTKDWTDKLDISQPIETILMGELESKHYIFTRTDDSDYYNTFYKNNWGQVIGEKKYDIENEFLTSEKKIENIFAPTAMLNTTFNGLIIPHVYKLEGNQISVMSIKTRSLFWGGKINLSWGSWALRYGNLTTFIPYTDYPYVGTLDNPYTPTFDLNFAVPKEIYIDTYPAYTWTSANLGTDYWDDYLNRISDKNSRIVRMNLFLDEEDINSFDWRCPIIVDGAKYLVNKIENYDILSRKTTLVELILI